VRARQNAGRKKGGGCAVQGAVRAACDLVKGSQGQPAARQALVDLGHAKGQNPARYPVSGLDPADLFVHLGNSRNVKET